jgi:hypothetical protein
MDEDFVLECLPTATCTNSQDLNRARTNDSMYSMCHYDIRGILSVMANLHRLQVSVQVFNVPPQDSILFVKLSDAGLHLFALSLVSQSRLRRPLTMG